MSKILWRLSHGANAKLFTTTMPRGDTAVGAVISDRQNWMRVTYADLRDVARQLNAIADLLDDERDKPRTRP